MTLPRRLIPWISLLIVLNVLLGACQAPSPTLSAQTPTLLSTSAPTSIPRSPTPSTTPTPESPLGVKPSALRGTRVHVWFSGSPAMLEKISDEARLFNASNSYGIWVEARKFGSFMELSSRVQATLGTSDQADVVMSYPELAAGWEIGKPVRLDWAPYLTDPVWGLDPSASADIPSGLWRPAPAGGKQLGVPAYRSALALAYNL
ncbi:MAG: hypothetical protein PHQ40_18885, partial [Anaerolineaceae bacterium]|nr:hypothetical protein [Anaerolineaceae bacterium]